MFLGLHWADWLVLALYVAGMIWIGRATSAAVHEQTDFFLAGRKLGRLLQFFLNFGNMTDPSGAVKTSSLVYSQGVGGIWLMFQTLFMTPYYWFMMPWFRRARVTTMADLFLDRFGSRTLAALYAASAISIGIIVIGGGYLVTYKILDVCIVKSESAYTETDTRMVNDFREFAHLNEAYREGRLDPSNAQRHAYLKKLHDRGDIKSYVSYVRPVPLYLILGTLVGIYITLGGMKAAAIADAFQGVLIVIFSFILIPFGLWKLGGVQEFHARLPDAMLDLFGSGGASEIAWYSIAAILLVSMVQLHGLSGNMPIAGSAKNEAAAGWGAVSGGFTKRLMIIAWCFCGLVAFALFGGGLSDSDAVWGMLCRSLLAPGFFGLMLVGLLAAEMAVLSSQCLTISALFVKNIYLLLCPKKSEAQGLGMARVLVGVALLSGVGIALLFRDIVAFAKMQLTLNVAFGAAVFTIFKWRRVTSAGTLTAVILSLVVIVLIPLTASIVPALRSNPSLLLMSDERREIRTVRALKEDISSGRAAQVGDRIKKERMIPPRPVFFDSIVTIDPQRPELGSRGQGRFYIELFILSACGLDVAHMLPAQLLALTYVFDSVLPFLLLIIFSFLTIEKDPERAVRFYAKMRTPVNEDLQEDATRVTENAANFPATEERMLFPHSVWEFQKWNRGDARAFALCCLVALSILGGFSLLLTLGRS